jgi:L-ascorbate metabolism protein UlaG (beta-lactamase superfamily)
MKVTYYGHACFAVESGQAKLLFDPFIRHNPLAGHVSVDEIQASHILVSHAHGDHLAEVEEIANRCGAQLISNWEIVQWFGQKGITNAHPLNFGGGMAATFGRVDMTYAQHSSSFPDGTYGGNPAGFMVHLQEENRRFYYSGDTALFSDMKLLGELYKPEVAFLPIGDNFTMGYEHAAIAAEMVGVKEVVGLHFDTFPYIVIDHAKAIEAFSNRGIRLHLLELGQSITL